MIEVERLRKSFNSLVAVDDVSFTVGEGEIFGLLGPNGAGKTTSINMISGVLKPDGGRVLIGGRDIWLEPKKVKQGMAVVPQEVAVYEDLTARDNLNFWGSLYGLRGADLRERVDEVLTRAGLSDRAGDKVKGFSGGMKRRLNLCMGLLHRPSVLLLDEPTVGIDPQARINILEVVRTVAASGTTVLYTTHYMDEAQELCDRIAIIDHGSILTVGTLDELTRLAGEAEVLRLTGSFSEEAARRKLESVDGVRLLKADDGMAVLSVEADGPGLLSVLPKILEAKVNIEDVSIQQPNLQSVFISLTGKELRD
ncbi:MAG: ABC transporter ATP-binding protein [Acidobacteria bacterium]|jgi:ABC-2 type transport system ATP-binding protein|nr:ABC transporter ATP-binding protein [Acidobacteriota bacterium]